MTFPMLPEEIKVDCATRFQSYDIMNIGEEMQPLGEELTRISWSCKIPGEKRQLTSVLDEAQTKLDSKYVMLMEKDTLIVRKKGSNTDIYYFHGKNVESTKDHLTLQGLVTKVLVYGKSEEDQRPPLLETVDGDLQYGTLQEIITKDSNKTLNDAKKGLCI